MRSLGGLNGRSFDQAYAQDEVRDHQEDVALFKKEASSGTNCDPRASDCVQNSASMQPFVGGSGAPCCNRVLGR